tara:strand:- start:8578 stop:10104 length:1527 start_codon:yes stop_codon:yes gene_type:complete
VVYKLKYKDTFQFSDLVLDYLNEDKKIKPFINYFPRKENFIKQIKLKEKQKINRNVLVEILKKQNQSLKLSTKTDNNIDLILNTNTFTITTGHQLCLCTGPLYFIYKIVSTINLCEKLTEQNKGYHFVPVFWMASEDHDLEEINHINLFGKKAKWNTEQTGAVGQMNLSKIEDFLLEIKKYFKNSANKKIFSVLEESYLKHNNLSEATRFLVNELFGKYGLVIIDSNSKELKEQFVQQMKKDICYSTYYKYLKQTTEDLSKNYKIQANVRKVNFFEISKRSRKYITDNYDETKIEDNPEIFSPNVLMRPLFQEIIMPNVSYVGGSAEISYWLQLKSVFDIEKIPFPILVLRNSLMLVSSKQKKVLNDKGFNLEDIFLSREDLHKKYILNHFNKELSLEKNKKKLKKMYEELLLKTFDDGLKRSIRAQIHKQIDWITNLEKKIIREKKKAHLSSLNQIDKIKKQLFPNNKLQERYENFLMYYILHNDKFIEIVKDEVDPLSANFVVLDI